MSLQEASSYDPLARTAPFGTPFQRRRHARVNTRLRVEYRITGEPAVPEVPAARLARPGAQVRQSVATSVSGGGLLVSTGERLPVGTRLAMTVYVPAATLAGGLMPIACEARVVWTDIVSVERPDEYQCGVEFVTIDERDRQRLVAFIHATEATATVV
ncbi:MAG TPA: PilZ domain-containing protein [Thermodesulfobacteriota bacterium]